MMRMFYIVFFKFNSKTSLWANKLPCTNKHFLKKYHVAAPAQTWEMVAGLAATEATRGRELIRSTPAVILVLVSLLIASHCV